MDFHSMKRRELQALCKEHKIRANLTNLEMADRLSSLFKSSLINSAEKLSENDSDVAEKRLKKARFSSENENKRIGTTPKRSEITSAEVLKDKLVVADGGITQPEMGLRRSKRIADKHVNGPIMAAQNANRRKSMMPNIKKVMTGIPVADEEKLEDNHQKRLESTPKFCLKKQTSVYTELSDSKKVGNSVIEGNEELQIKELPLVLSVTGVVDTMALGNEELQPEESPLSAYAVAYNSVIATVNDDNLCCQAPLKGSNGIEHGMPMSMGETSRKVGDEQEPQEVIGAKEWKPMFSKDFEVFEEQMIAVHGESTSSSVKGMDGLKDQNGEQIVSSAVLRADDCGKGTNDSHQFMEAVPQLVMKFGETDCHLKEMVQGMDEKDFLVQGVDEVNKVKDVEATRNGIDEASGVPTEVLLVNEDGMEEDAAAKLLHGNETQTLTVETNEGHGSSDYFNVTSEDYHSNQKLCLQHEQIEASKSMLADRGAEIFEGIMSVREDSVYNDSVGVGCQESREEDMNFGETDCHLKEMVQGMDEKDLLVQKVIDVMKVKDVEATEVLLMNEDGLEEDADTKLLYEEYHSNQKLCLQHECIKVSNTTLADRGAEIFDGIMSAGKDPVYNDSVDVGYQESTGEATAVEETTKIDYEGNLCMGGAHHDLDGRLSLAGEKGMEITCSSSGDVKEIRTHETSIGETSSPIIFEEINIDRAGIMCSSSAGLSATVSDYSFHCQTPLKGSDESEQGMAKSLDETSRKVGEEEEPQEVIEAKENDYACLFKDNVMQNTEEEAFSPGSVESEQGMPMSMGETSRKVGDEQEPQEVIGAKEWKPMFSKDFEVFEKQMIAVHGESTSPSVKGMDGLQDQHGEQIVSSAVLKADDCSKDTNDSHQFMEAVPQLVMKFGETDFHLKEMVQRMDEKDFLVQGVDEVTKVKDVEATRNGIDEASGVPTEVLLVNEDGMEEDAAAKLLHCNETQTLTVETNEGHGSSDYFNDTSEEYHSNQKLCLRCEQIEASKSMLADRGAEIFEGIMSVREDSVYNDSVGEGCQERREEDMNIGETDCHLKEMVQGMDEKDLLIQKVVDVMKVKDVEATEVLLMNEAGLEEDAYTKLLHEEYHSNQKLCLQQEYIKVSNTTLADRGAEIFDGIMYAGKDPVYNDSVDVGYQESTEEATAVEETTKIYFEGNLCMDGAHHDLDGRLSLAGEKGMEITCSSSGDVKEIRTHETSTGETSCPIIFEETNIDRAGIMCSASAGLSVTVSDYSLHCQTPLKGSDESEQGMAMSLDETSRKVGEEEEPQEVIEAKENDDACLFKVNVRQNTEEEVFSPGSVESEQENQLRMLFGTPDTFSTCCNEKKSPSNDAENAEGTAFRSNESDAECLFKFNSLQNTEKEITSPSSMESEQENLLKILFVTPDTKSTSLSEQQTSSQAAEISGVSMSSENNLKKSILGRFSHGKSQVVELKEREVNERTALKSKGEEITGKGSNGIDEEIASPGPLGFINVMFEDGNEKGNVKTPFGDLLEEGGGCIEISGKVKAEILGDDVSKADDCTNDSRPFVETVPQFDMTIGETDHHLKELFLGMDERDFLVQGVVDIMKVKDMEAARHGIDATDGKHFDLGGEASGIPTEELLRNEDAMKEDAPAKLLHFSLTYLNDSFEHGDTEFSVDSDMLSSELKLFGRADEVEGDKSNAWSRKNNFVIENSEDAEENGEASSETKLRMADQPPAYDNFASDKDAWKGQLERDIVETKELEVISEGKIPVRHLFSTILTQKTPGKSIMTADMKENAQSFKRQPSSLIAAKSTKKRRALEELCEGIE